MGGRAFVPGYCVLDVYLATGQAFVELPNVGMVVDREQEFALDRAERFGQAELIGPGESGLVAGRR